MPAPSAAVLAVAALLGGAAAGVGLERAGVLSPLDEPEAVADVRRDVVDVLDCPEGTVVAALTRGDRIVATGRSEDGAWLEIRSPLGLDDRVWLPAATVTPDGDRSALDDLPERGCEQVRPTTTTSSTSTSTTSTTVPETTTTTEPPPAPTTTAPPPPRPTTTTAPVVVDTSPPVIGTLQRNPVVIRDLGTGCPSVNNPTTSLVQAPVNDDHPENLSVSMTFSGTGLQGPISGSLNNQSRQDNFFFGTLGPFPADTAPNAGQMLITVTVTASDGFNQVQASVTVELRSCN